MDVSGGAVASVDDAGFPPVVLESARPVLVKFWAPWCGSCRMLAPAVAETAALMQDRLTVVEMDTSAEPKTAESLGVMTLPTMILFKDGQEELRLTGARSARTLLNELTTHLDAAETPA